LVANSVNVVIDNDVEGYQDRSIHGFQILGAVWQTREELIDVGSCHPDRCIEVQDTKLPRWIPAATTAHGVGDIKWIRPARVRDAMHLAAT